MEIVVRAVVVFAFLWLVTRAVGRSTLGELSTFQLVLYVTMGDLVQQAVTQQDYSVTAAVLAVSTFAVLTVAVSWVQWRFPRTRPWVNGRPVLVVHQGEPVARALRWHRLSVDDLRAAARQQGIRDLADVEAAILEADGRLSFLQRETADGDHSGAPETPAPG